MEQTDRKAALRRALSALLALVLVWVMLPAMAETSHGVVTGDKVLFRKSTSGSDYYDHLNRGWVAKVLDEVKANKYTWYKVETNTPTNPKRTYIGYIRSDFFRMLTPAEEAAWLVNKPQPDPALAGIVSPVTDKPESGATPTPTPKAEAKTNPPVLSGDYGLVTVSGANLRREPAGQSLTALTKDALVKILAFPSSGNPWYKVDYNGQVGYLQTDHLRALSPSELAAYQQTSAPVTTTTGTITTTPTPISGEASGTLKITKTSTNLRKEPGGTSLFQYAIGTELPFYGAPVFSLGYTWAKVADTSRNLTGYIRSDCYEIVSGSQTNAPTATPTSNASSASVRITLGGTNLRQAPGGTPIAVLDRGRILPFYGNPSAHGGYNWVYVWDEKSQLYGYVRSDCYEFVSGAPQPVTTPSPTPTGSSGQVAGKLTLIKGGVNLRNAPGGKSFAQLDKGLTMNYFSFAVAGGYTWYMVDSPKGVGYVRSDVVKLEEGASSPTDAPATTNTPSTPAALGYLITIKSEINLRKTASSGAQVLGRVDKAQVMALTGPTQSANGYNWFRVTVNGMPGYLRGDCVRQLTQEEITNWLNHGKLPDLTPPDPNAPLPTTGYVLTIMTSVNVRSATSLDARVLGQVASAGTVFSLLATVNAGGRLWYKVSFQGQEGYLLSSVARMMNQKEYEDYISTQPTPSPTPAPTPTPTPPPEQMSKTAITRMTSVIIRSGAGSNNRNLGIIYRRGTVVALQGETAQVGTETWYAVRAIGINGWIRGDLLRVLTLEEEKALNATGDPDAPKPATYRSLRIGDSGEDVTRLQQELIRRNLLGSTGATGTYDSQTAEAVRNFQRANNLTVDGIAGSQTQHKIYGTVPGDIYEPGGGSTVVPGLYPVELVDWNKGDISTFWGKGEVAIMTDVTTGISLRIKRWSGGAHVDGEPLTAADTAALCRIYGVKNAQEILERNLYQRRPLWITLKGRSFAASLYGVPHNYPDGDTISDNEYNGQLCIHFYNSRVHTSGNVDRDHMRAIQKAYDLAPSKK